MDDGILNISFHLPQSGIFTGKDIARKCSSGCPPVLLNFIIPFDWALKLSLHPLSGRVIGAVGLQLAGQLYLDATG